MHVFNSLMPVFLLIALGKFLRQTRFSGELFSGLSQLTYRVGLPALLFIKISTARLEGAATLRITGVILLTTLIGTAVATLAAKLLHMPRKPAGAFIQGVVRANNAFVGLPVVIYALGDTHPEIGTIATLSLAPAFVFFNLISIFVLLGHSGEKRTVRKTAALFSKQLFTNPLIIASLAGGVVLLTGWQLPLFLNRSFNALGQAALPMALLSVGGSINFANLRGTAIYSLIAASLKVFAVPLIGYLVALYWPGITPVERTTALIFLACPTGVATYVLAETFDSDTDMAARIIVISTLLSALSLSIVIAIGG